VGGKWLFVGKAKLEYGGGKRVVGGELRACDVSEGGAASRSAAGG